MTMSHASASVVAVLATAATAAAAPIQWTAASGGNGHYYELITNETITWGDANAAAAACTYLGNPGHLATSTSQVENDFITTSLLDSAARKCFWIGGYQLEGAQDPAADWAWVTGEPWEYTNWDEGEPNDHKGLNENSLEIYHDDPPHRGKWNDKCHDVIVSGYAGGYIVEYVPEPASLSMLATGVVLAWLRQRRQRRSTG